MNVARGARTFDAVVIGGDIDGLVAAARLAGGGSKVLLINESDALGGAARELEFAPGYRAVLLRHGCAGAAAGPRAGNQHV